MCAGYPPIDELLLKKSNDQSQTSKKKKRKKVQKFQRKLEHKPRQWYTVSWWYCVCVRNFGDSVK